MCGVGWVGIEAWLVSFDFPCSGAYPSRPRPHFSKSFNHRRHRQGLGRVCVRGRGKGQARDKQGTGGRRRPGSNIQTAGVSWQLGLAPILVLVRLCLTQKDRQEAGTRAIDARVPAATLCAWSGHALLARPVRVLTQTTSTQGQRRRLFAFFSSLLPLEGGEKTRAQRTVGRLP